MGVHGLYSWIQSRFPTSLTSVPPDFNTKNLYIDLNGVIHQVAGNDLAFQLEDQNDYYQDERLKELEKFELIADEIRFFINSTKPTDTVYLAADGVSPQAKLNEQRSRRFANFILDERRPLVEQELRNEYETKGLLVPPKLNLNGWNRLSISVGTGFMLRLSEFLHDFIETEKQTNSQWKHLRIIFSDHSVPGEGEHKIANFIRASTISNANTPVLTTNIRRMLNLKTTCDHLVVSDDGDVFFITLSLKQRNVFILRNEERRSMTIAQNLMSSRLRLSKRNRVLALENSKLLGGQSEHDIKILDYELMNIDNIKQVVQSYIETQTKQKVNIQRICNDLVLIGCLLGNDFIPKLPGLKIKSHLDDLIKVYLSQLLQSRVTRTPKAYIRDMVKDSTLMSWAMETVLELQPGDKLPYLTSDLGDINFKNFGQYVMAISSDLGGELKTHHNLKKVLHSYDARLPYTMQTRERAAKVRSIITSFFLYNDLKEESSLDFKVTKCISDKQKVLSFNACDTETKLHIKEFALRNYLAIEDNEESGLLKVKLSKQKEDVIKNHLFKTFVEEFLMQVNIKLDHVLQQEVDFGVEFEGIAFACEKKLKQSYYDLKFDNKVDGKSVSLEYIKMLQFILKYYIVGLPSWSFSYPFSCSPLISDLGSTLQSLEPDQNFDFEISSPNEPLSQLLTFANLNSTLLPASLKDIFSEGKMLEKYPTLRSIMSKSLSLNSFQRNGEELTYRYTLKLPFISSSEMKELDQIYKDCTKSGSFSARESVALETKTDPFIFPRTFSARSNKPVNLHLDYYQRLQQGSSLAQASQYKAIYHNMRRYASKFIR